MQVGERNTSEWTEGAGVGGPENEAGSLGFMMGSGHWIFSSRYLREHSSACAVENSSPPELRGAPVAASSTHTPNLCRLLCATQAFLGNSSREEQSWERESRVLVLDWARLRGLLHI